MLSASRAFVCAASQPVRRIPRYTRRLSGLESVDWRYFERTEDAVSWLEEAGYTVLAVEQCEGSTMLQNFHRQPGRKYAVVFGNEVKGVQQQVVDSCDGCLEIPQYGTKHSLNVSVTAGIVLWHLSEKL